MTSVAAHAGCIRYSEGDNMRVCVRRGQSAIQGTVVVAAGLGLSG
jgi:hypothetical protein